MRDNTECLCHCGDPECLLGVQEEDPSWFAAYLPNSQVNPWTPGPEFTERLFRRLREWDHNYASTEDW